MKSRPRKIERLVAEHLSRAFSDVGSSPVQRIPILGRTGPDITLNDKRLVVDVKSRLQCPRMMMAGKDELVCFHTDGLEIIGVRIGELPLRRRTFNGLRHEISSMAAEWLSHMEAWTRTDEPDGISAIILHIPGMPVVRVS